MRKSIMADKGLLYTWVYLQNNGVNGLILNRIPLVDGTFSDELYSCC
jgi:hypothetical protein